MISNPPSSRACETPTGFRPSAQGWPEERGPTLGNAPAGSPNPNGVASVLPPPAADATPLGLEHSVAGIPQGSACRATLGWRTKRRWRLPMLDALVGKVAEAVERLQEYRTALITSAITGKIDVRNILKTDMKGASDEN